MQVGGSEGEVGGKDWEEKGRSKTKEGKIKIHTFILLGHTSAWKALLPGTHTAYDISGGPKGHANL